MRIAPSRPETTRTRAGKVYTRENIPLDILLEVTFPDRPVHRNGPEDTTVGHSITDWALGLIFLERWEETEERIRTYAEEKQGMVGLYAHVPVLQVRYGALKRQLQHTRTSLSDLDLDPDRMKLLKDYGRASRKDISTIEQELMDIHLPLLDENHTTIFEHLQLYKDGRFDAAVKSTTGDQPYDITLRRSTELRTTQTGPWPIATVSTRSGVPSGRYKEFRGRSVESVQAAALQWHLHFEDLARRLARTGYGKMDDKERALHAYASAHATGLAPRQRPEPFAVPFALVDNGTSGHKDMRATRILYDHLAKGMNRWRIALQELSKPGWAADRQALMAAKARLAPIPQEERSEDPAALDEDREAYLQNVRGLSDRIYRAQDPAVSDTHVYVREGDGLELVGSRNLIGPRYRVLRRGVPEDEQPHTVITYVSGGGLPPAAVHRELAGRPSELRLRNDPLGDVHPFERPRRYMDTDPVTGQQSRTTVIWRPFRDTAAAPLRDAYPEE